MPPLLVRRHRCLLLAAVVCGRVHGGEGADSDLVLRVGVGDFEHGHGPRHGLHGGEDVLVDALGEALPVLLGEAAAVDDAHLADEGGLPALPGACTVQPSVYGYLRW